MKVHRSTSVDSVFGSGVGDFSGSVTSGSSGAVVSLFSVAWCRDFVGYLGSGGVHNLSLFGGVCHGSFVGSVIFSSIFTSTNGSVFSSSVFSGVSTFNSGFNSGFSSFFKGLIGVVNNLSK